MADVLYHKCCFHNFHSAWWESNKSINNESEQNNSDYTHFYELVKHHIINKHSIHTVFRLCNFYHNIANTKIRSIDLKKN